MALEETEFRRQTLDAETGLESQVDTFEPTPGEQACDQASAEAAGQVEGVLSQMEQTPDQISLPSFSEALFTDNGIEVPRNTEFVAPIPTNQELPSNPNQADSDANNRNSDTRSDNASPNLNNADIQLAASLFQSHERFGGESMNTGMNHG